MCRRGEWLEKGKVVVTALAWTYGDAEIPGKAVGQCQKAVRKHWETIHTFWSAGGGLEHFTAQSEDSEAPRAVGRTATAYVHPYVIWRRHAECGGKGTKMGVAMEQGVSLGYLAHPSIQIQCGQLSPARYMC